GERAFERSDVAVVGDEEEVADRMEMRVRADLVRKSLDVRKRVLRELDVDLARELQTNTARVLPRRAGAEPVAFEDENVAHTFLCEVVRDGGADDPATNDDDIGIATHRGDGMQSPLGLLVARIRASRGSGVMAAAIAPGAIA